MTSAFWHDLLSSHGRWYSSCTCNYFSLLRWQGGRVFLMWFMHGCGAGLTSTRMNSSMSNSASMPLTWSMTACVSTHTIMREWCHQALVSCSQWTLYATKSLLKNWRKILSRCTDASFYVWYIYIYIYFKSFNVLSPCACSWSQPSKYWWVHLQYHIMSTKIGLEDPAHLYIGCMLSDIKKIGEELKRKSQRISFLSPCPVWNREHHIYSRVATILTKIEIFLSFKIKTIFGRSCFLFGTVVWRSVTLAL